MTEDDKEIVAIAREFGNKYRLAQEIMKLRKNQMPEEVPEIIPVYAVKQHCATGMEAHFSLQYEVPDDGHSYYTFYQPTNSE